MMAVVFVLAALAALMATAMITKMDRFRITGGITAGTMGAEATLQLGDDAKRVVALVFGNVDPTYTTAEGHGTIAELNCTGWPYPVRLLTGPFVTSGPATNSSGQGMIPDVVPTNLPAIGGSVIKGKAHGSSTMTTAQLLEVGVMYAGAGGVSQRTMDRLRLASGIDPIVWGDVAFYTAGAGTTVDAENAMTTVPTTGIVLPAGINVSAYRAFIYKTGAITAGEEVFGDIMLKSSLSNFSPQYLIANAISATLGTPVGTGLYHDSLPYIPIQIDENKIDVRINPYAIYRTAVTTNAGAALGLIGD